MNTTYKVIIDAEIYVETDDSVEAIRVACKQLPLRDNWPNNEIQVEELDDDTALDEIPSGEIIYTGGCDD